MAEKKRKRTKAEQDEVEVSSKDPIIEQVKKAPIKTVNSIIAQIEPVLAREAMRWRRYRQKYRMALTSYMDQTVVTRAPNFFANYIFANVETVKSNLPRELPAIIVESIDEGDRVADDLLSKILLASLTRANLRKKMKVVAHHAAITGLGWFKLTVRPDAYFGLPDNAITTPLPEDVLVDPDAVPFYGPDMRVTARYIIERRRNVPLEEVRAEFGDFDFDLEEDEPGDSGFSKSDAYNPKDTLPKLGTVADLLECWFNTFDSDKPWYRMILWGKHVVQELEPSPYDHPYPPYFPYFDGEDDGADNFYRVGIGEVEEIEPLQDKNSMLDAQIFKSIRQVINRQRVINKALGLRKSMVDNTEGRVYEVSGNPKEAMVWDNPPQLTTDVYTYRTMTDYLIEVVSGITGTQAGRKPTGIQAAKAIDRLSQNSDRRIEEKRDELLAVVQIMAFAALRNIFQFWEEERIVKLANGVRVKVIGDYPESAFSEPEFDMLGSAAMDPMAGMLGGILPPEPGMAGAMLGEMAEEPAEEQDDDEDPEMEQKKHEWRVQNNVDLVLSDVKDKDFEVLVISDSALPERKEDRAQLAADLFRLGVIDRREVLEFFDWPNREELLRRLKEEETGPSAQANAKANAEQQLMAQQQQQQIDPNQIVQMVLQQLMPMLGGGGVPQPAPVAGGAPVPGQPGTPGQAGGGIPPEVLAAIMGQLGG